MPVSPAYNPTPRFVELGDGFYDEVTPARFPKLILRWRDQHMAARLGLDMLSDGEWEAHMGHFEPLPDNLTDPLALRYHGHQFRHYNPHLGDGRGFLFAELCDAHTGLELSLGTKGSGTTPWSRGGDGRLTLKGGVREVLATKMLEALGVSTSKSLSVFETGEALERRDEPSPTRACVLVRAGHSHVRFGSFQRHAFYEDRDRLAKLLSFVATRHHPEVIVADDLEETAHRWFACVVQSHALLTAQWMVAGFVHGVLNTDNMNIHGESFDYGPYRFLPRYDPNFVAAYFDHSGLYRYGHQPSTVVWNLERLADALASICTRSVLDASLDRFEAAFWTNLTSEYMRRFGLVPKDPKQDAELVMAIIEFMYESKMPFQQLFFDWFGGDCSRKRALASPHAQFYDAPSFSKVRWHLRKYTMDRPDRLEHAYFEGDAPCDMLIDEIERIWARIDEDDDWTMFDAKIAHIHLMGDALC